MLSQSEENYLKIIFSLQFEENKLVSTNDIAQKTKTKASSVTDMLKKLSDKKLVNYKKYRGVKLTKLGEFNAKKVIRSHRLWECFMVDKLGFAWNEVHETAEQLEHVKSDELIDRLDEFLGKPKFDPHGDPIPDKEGNIAKSNTFMLSELEIGHFGILEGLKNSSDDFLKYLNNKKLALGDKIKVKNIELFDNSVLIKTKNYEFTISSEVAQNLLVKII